MGWVQRVKLGGVGSGLGWFRVGWGPTAGWVRSGQVGQVGSKGWVGSVQVWLGWVGLCLIVLGQVN